MNKNPFAPDKENLPEVLPIFPLTGVLLLPGGNLPLNIFEQRYLSMVEAALASHRMIGMIQPRPEESNHKNEPSIYNIGCAGKIVEFAETTDGRYLISLSGICRFAIEDELSTMTGFRQVKPQWQPYHNDLEKRNCLNLDRKKLKSMLGQYFDKNGMSCDWKAIESADDNKLVTCLSMACPLSPSEKQALLEAENCKNRAELFMTMIEMAIQDSQQQAEH